MPWFAARACRPRPRAPLTATALRFGLGLGLGLGLVLGLGGCDDAPPSFAAIDEPEQALRPASARGEVPEDAHVVDYWIDARLDEHAHEIHGTLRMAWRNRTARSVDRLPMHLYMNAFRAEDSAWMAQARGSHRGQSLARERWGFVEVSRVELVARNPEQPQVTLEQAPSQPGQALSFSEDADPSTMTVTLPEPVGAGDSVVLELEFTTRLPQAFARTGYYDDFHMAGQWFPKVAVLEEQRGWQAHTFGLFSEFYADFGDYEVFLDVPSDYVVGASGVRVGEEQPSEGRKRLHYRAQMVHDFAWAADPNFIEHWGEYEGIRIRQLIQPEFVDDAQTHLEAQKLTLASMEARFGPYPWSTITIVHAPEGAGGAGGMEYPTFYTTSDIADIALPAWLLRERMSGVFTTVHEFGHQYFQGLFASNEHAQPWLDEGMNTTANQLVYWDAYGDDPWVVEVLGQALTTNDVLSLSMLGGADLDPLDQSADRFDPLVDSYGSVTYQKTAAVMLTLRELCGRAPWDRAMARYAELARFRHPDGALLERTLVQEIGDELGRFAIVGEGGPGTVWLDIQDYLDQGLRGAALPEFRLLKLGNRRLLGDAGWHRAPAGQPLPPEPPQAVIETERALGRLFGYAPPLGPPGLTHNETPADWDKSAANLDDARVEGYVIVQRRTSFRMPVEVLVEFADGERSTLVWDGQADHHRFDFPGRRVTMAIVDPRGLLLLEAHKLDNAGWARGTKDTPQEPLSAWLGDINEATNLALLGGLGI